MNHAPELLEQCAWPALPAPYDQALHAAVEFILSRFEPTGLIAAGSVLRGTPDATSDLDLYVIHRAPFRQRIQKFFNGVPAEIFVNPPAQVERYFVSEQAAARPITAHMLATGHVLLSLDPEVKALRERARALLNEPPTLTDAQRTWARYLAANLYEDALDIAERDPDNASLLLAQAVTGMLQFAFQDRGSFLPRSKALLDKLAALDPDLADAARRFFMAGTFEARLELAAHIADTTIGARGFFEWEAAPETVALA